MTITISESGNRTYDKASDSKTAVRHFDALADASETAADISRSTSLPSINDPHPSDILLRASRHALSQEGASNLWRVKVFYSLPRNGTKHEGESDSPMDTEATYKWGTIHQQVPIDLDIHGNPLLNSAGQGFATPPTRKIKSYQLTYTRYQRYFKIATALRFVNAINADAFLGAKANHVMCLDILPTHMFSVSAEYLQVAYDFEFRDGLTWGRDPFDLRILDQGNMALGVVDQGDYETEQPNTLFKIKNVEDENVQNVLLDGGGVPLDKTLKLGSGNVTRVDGLQPPIGARKEHAPARRGAGDTRAVFLRYDNYKREKFGELGL